MNITEAIKNRVSTRTYTDKVFDKETLNKIQSIIENAVGNPPMKSPLKFDFIAVDKNNRSENGEKIGTYGVVKNQQGYIYGICPKNIEGYLDFSYTLEKIILELTKVNIGTVWLGGTFTKKRLFKKVQFTDNETIPAITALGYRAVKMRIGEKIAKKVTKSDFIKEWHSLFYDEDFTSFLTEEKAGVLKTAFEMVRIGPSSMNSQTWRLVKQGNRVHFYNELKHKREKMSLYQALDVGIAMCHFDLTCKELGYPGEFIKKEPMIETPNDAFSYFSTYVLSKDIAV